MPIKALVAELGRRRFLAILGSALLAIQAKPPISSAQDKAGFPDGFDAPEAAPDSHKVIFENKLVRVLEVTVPSPGKSEPMHHHRWPSFFLDWDTGGRTPHVRYHRPDGSVKDEPSVARPLHSGRWTVQWMKPEPMHAIEVVNRDAPVVNHPPLLRVEIKCSSQG